MSEPQNNASSSAGATDSGENLHPSSSICGQMSFPVLAILLFLGALFWARQQDPFSRKWFTLKTADHVPFKCVAVLPKPLRPRPVIIYAHGAGGNLMNDGNDVRQMAELGLSVVSLEYNQTNPATFGPQLEALLHYIGRQSWADTNAIAWVGYSMGSIRMFDFALQHPEQQPRLLVLLGGAGLPEGQTNSPLPSLHCPVFLIHGDQDQTFPFADTKRLASILQTNALPVDMKIIPGMSHGMEPDRAVIFRSHWRILSHASGRQRRLAELPFHRAMAGRSAALVDFPSSGSGMGCWLVRVVKPSQAPSIRKSQLGPW